MEWPTLSVVVMCRNEPERIMDRLESLVQTDYSKGQLEILMVAGANRNDMKLTEATLESQVVLRPEVTPEARQHMCRDKGYDYPEVRDPIEDWGYTGHIKARGEETHAKQTIPGYRSRRSVVERTHSWLNRFRRLLIRWEKKAENYVALLHFVCAWIPFRAAGLIG